MVISACFYLCHAKPQPWVSEFFEQNNFQLCVCKVDKNCPCVQTMSVFRLYSQKESQTVNLSRRNPAPSQPWHSTPTQVKEFGIPTHESWILCTYCTVSWLAKCFSPNKLNEVDQRQKHYLFAFAVEWQSSLCHCNIHLLEWRIDAIISSDAVWSQKSECFARNSKSARGPAVTCVTNQAW